MAQQALDHAQMVKLANDVLAVHGEGAAGYICDKIIEHMGGDPVVEDMWHAVLDLVCQIEEANAATSAASSAEHSRENRLQ